MLEVGDGISALDDLEFRRNGDVVSLGELRGGGPLVLVFLRHFG